MSVCTDSDGGSIYKKGTVVIQSESGTSEYDDNCYTMTGWYGPVWKSVSWLLEFSCGSENELVRSNHECPCSNDACT
ncbi:hypothetical protein JYT91_01465 [archaeon AH-315-M20]|nr:hypothetical protein [archaeon AH-315-M20]